MFTSALRCGRSTLCRYSVSLQDTPKCSLAIWNVHINPVAAFKVTRGPEFQLSGLSPFVIGSACASGYIAAPARNQVSNNTTYLPQNFPALSGCARALHTKRARDGTWLKKAFDTSSAGKARHWLPDRLRTWLDGVTYNSWKRGLTSRLRLKEIPGLDGREHEIWTEIQRKHEALCKRHADLVVDAPSQSHLQTACMVLATWQTLQPWVKDNERLVTTLQEHMGRRAPPLLQPILQFALLIAAWVRGIEAFDLMGIALKGLRHDYGAAFASSWEEDPRRGLAWVAVRRCFYHDLFTREGAPQLTTCCCCSSDSIWFDFLDAKQHGVEFAHRSSLSRNDPACKLLLKKSAKK